MLTNKPSAPESAFSWLRRIIPNFIKKAQNLALIVSVVGCLFGTGLIKWSSLDCHAKSAINIVRNGNSFSFWQFLSMLNDGNRAGYVKSVTGTISDVLGNKTLADFEVDSCVIGNISKDLSIDFSVNSSSVTDGLFRFMQTSNYDLSLKAGVVYKLEITFVVTNKIVFFHTESVITKSYYFSLNDTQINALNQQTPNGKTCTNNIKLVPIQNP